MVRCVQYNCYKPINKTHIVKIPYIASRQCNSKSNSKPSYKTPYFFIVFEHVFFKAFQYLIAKEKMCSGLNMLLSMA